MFIYITNKKDAVVNRYKIIYQKLDEKERVIQDSFVFLASTPLEFLLNANHACQKNYVRATRDILSITEITEKEGKLDRNNVMEQAKELINGDRAKSYGDPVVSHTRIGRGWGAILGIKDISASTVALMMTWLKISRIVLKGNQKDSFVDAIGYLSLASECQEESKDEQERSELPKDVG